MPRRIATYTAFDWLKLRPATQAYKARLLDLADRRYSQLPAPDAAQLQRVLATLAGRKLVATVAFNSSWVIGWQLRFIRRHLVDATFLVADNSTDAAARLRIAELCRQAGVAYLALPGNPYRGSKHASRSHGLALNWIYRNVVRRLGPSAWGVFDHDLFPTRPFDPQARLGGQPFYGDLEARPGGSYLWPGYCLFSGEFEPYGRLDFRQDWFVGLDTGGMNAGLLAQAGDLSAMRFARRRSIGPARNVAVTIDDIDWFDDCVHLGNASGWYRPTAEREVALERLLQDIYDGRCSPPWDGAPG